MKKIGLLTILFVGGLLLTGCINKDVEQDNTILTGGFTPVPRVDKENQQDSKQPEIPEVFSNIDLSKINIRTINLQELKPEELLYLRENIDYSKLSDEDKMYLMIGHDPYDYVEDDGYHIITSHLISDECAYNSDEYGIRMNLDKWNDCKISYQEIEDKNGVKTMNSFSIYSLPVHDKGWFGGYGLLGEIYVVPINKKVDDYIGIEIGGNNNYRFYIDVGNASPSYYYTYYPISYDDFVCDNMKKLDNGTMVDKNGRYCHERDKDWKKLGIDMPDPMLGIYEIASYKMKEFIQFYDL